MNRTTTIERNAVLAAGLTAVVWGATGIFVRWLPQVSPIGITAGRLVAALVVAFAIIAFSTVRRAGLKEARKSCCISIFTGKWRKIVRPLNP
jgi:EamA domain-containing membrane protein RarD